MPSISPNGKWIVFAGQKNTSHIYDQNQNTLWLLNDHQSLQALETPPLQGRAPVWSPDGRWIAFESDRGSPDGRYAVFFVRRDGSGLTQVTDYALCATHPVWSQDSRHLVVAVGLGTATHIAEVDLPDKIGD
jgi:Tol biopolymer transport system component